MFTNFIVYFCNIYYAELYWELSAMIYIIYLKFKIIILNIRRDDVPTSRLLFSLVCGYNSYNLVE